ncbi:TOMM precursor leader peptide-binding protein [Actinoplanes solisilvae]|uniref:TOMM precursor leader peptide-binding protein n=1 Tax=Actinoplanes solisilvae TaxID=2486853 RepID=UPI000FD9CC33|nr:TOMM precursor leader peptide-binding protein [Actinoplanes solisilvae]
MTAPVAAARPTPLSAAAVHLADHLHTRWKAQPLGPEPRVARLGGGDAAGPDRRDANVHLSAAAVLIGPAGGCGHCLAIRWQRLRGRSERDALETGDRMAATGPWPKLTAFHVDAVWDLYRLSYASVFSPDRAVSRLDLGSLRVDSYPMLAEPLCPGCSDAQPDVPVVFELQPRPKPGPDVYRLRAPADYAMPEAALVNPVCGVLGAGTQLTITSPTTAPVNGSVFIRGYGGLLDVSWSGQTTGYAKSRSLAYLEGLERYAGTHRRRNLTPVVAAYDDLGDQALHPDRCGRLPDAVYDADPILQPFDPRRPIPWVWGQNLHTGGPVLVPRRLSFYSSPAAGDTFLLSSSSGCATGSCLEEAILFGLLELIERDAFLLAWYGDLTLPRIDLDSGPPAVRAMADRAELQGYRLYAYDNRIDLDVPVVTSVAVRHDGGPGLLSFAAAAHLDPSQALAGALAETLTYVPHQPSTVRRRRSELEAMADDYSLVQRLPDHSALFGLPRMAVHAASYLTDDAGLPADRLYAERPRTMDLRDDLRRVLDLLRTRELEAIVVDQTTPEQAAIGLHSVCTIVPGLLPIDFGWRRQRAPHMPRLRTAPAAAGFTVGDLRLVPHPFP